MNKKVRPPVLPDGVDVILGLLCAFGVGILMVFQRLPFWSYILAPGILYAIIVYTCSIAFEDGKQFVKAEKLDNEIKKLLAEITSGAMRMKNTTDMDKKNLENGVNDAKAILEELENKPSTIRYGGLTETVRQIRHVVEIIQEMLQVQANPRRAGEKLAQVIALSSNAYQGFADGMATQLEHVNSGDILDLTINAEILATLRNFFSKPEQTGG